MRQPLSTFAHPELNMSRNATTCSSHTHAPHDAASVASDATTASAAHSSSSVSHCRLQKAPHACFTHK